MKYIITHETEYKFSSDVFLEPHYLRFKPKITPYTELLSFNLQLSIAHAGLKEQVDAENNIIHLYWFEGLHPLLSIKSESVVLLQDHNPFDFLLYPSEFFKLPFTYSDKQREILAPALKTEKISASLVDYGKHILVNSEYNTISFITDITTKIHSDFIIESRIEGIPYEADVTFDLKRASCRDLSWMLIQLLRHFGIASRFVSGYFYIATENPNFELHAWVEVFLPGAGWIGLDPSNGILTGNAHITVSTSAMSENTMPVTGSIRGSATSKLSSELLITAIE